MIPFAIWTHPRPLPRRMGQFNYSHFIAACTSEPSTTANSYKLFTKLLRNCKGVFYVTRVNIRPI